MKKYFIITIAVLSLFACARAPQQKFLIILQAGPESHEGMARAVHALLYTTELKQSGYEVTLIFDGAGTEWAKDLMDPENRLHPAYEKLQNLGVTEIICDFCSKAFHVQEELKQGKVPLVAEFEGHPSLVKWIRMGYTPIVL